MKLHANAALSLKQRERMVLRVIEQGWSLAKAAEAAEVSERTCSKWVARYRLDGAAGLLDRSSAPVVVANRTDEHTVQLLAALRRLRFTAPELADLLELPVSTISGILKRIGMGKLGRLGHEPAQRYERATPGELIHVDVKKLGRLRDGGGWRVHRRDSPQHRATRTAERVGYDYVHVAVDDHTRLAYAEIHPDEKPGTCAGPDQRDHACHSPGGG
jgi:transposase